MLACGLVSISAEATQLSDTVLQADTINVADDAAQPEKAKLYTERVTSVAHVDPLRFSDMHPVLDVSDMTTSADIQARIAAAHSIIAPVLPETVFVPELIVASINPLDVVEAQQAEPLVSPYAVSHMRIGSKVRDKLSYALNLSTRAMRTLNLTQDSVIGHHDGHPLILANILRDPLIHQVPHPDFYPQWVACLEREGFDRRRHTYPGANRLVRALAATESAGYACAISYASDYGAMGHFQFMHPTARAYGLSDPFTAAVATPAANEMMSDLLRRTDGNVRRALALYNSGEDPGSSVSAYAETRKHCERTAGTAACAIEENLRAARKGKGKGQAEEQPRRTLLDFLRGNGTQRRNPALRNSMR